MTRSTRARSDASQPQSPTTRRSLQLSPRQSTKLDDHRGGLLRSPTSPTNCRAPNRDLVDEPLPISPEEWIHYAQTKLRQAAVTLGVADAILELADIEPDLLEFLITADEEIRDTISEALYGLPFPTSREVWRESIISLLLERFRIFFIRLPPKLVDHKVDEECRRFTYLTTALEALDHLGFRDPGELEKEDEQVDPFFKIKSKSQKKRKASISIANQARRNTEAVDPRVFKAVDVEFPATHTEAISIQSSLLLSLKEMLGVFLASFANPELAAHAKTLYFKESLEHLPLKPTPATIVEDIPEARFTLPDAPDPGAFSQIHPLASAKYFDNDSPPGDWPVVISSRGMADLRRMRKRDIRGHDMVQKKIDELSEGFFSDSNQKRLMGLNTEVPIFEAKVSRDMRIVYQIDIRTNKEAKCDEQIIKIYGIYTHAQLDKRMWAQISHALERRGKEYRQRCLRRDTHRAPGQNVTKPVRFPHEEGATEIPSSSARGKHDVNKDGDDQDVDWVQTLGVFVPMSHSLITPFLNDNNDIFGPSDKEKEVIYHDSSCFVLGRSGTGKTTCIVFKIIGVEILFESMVDVAKPRQVFVTQSRILAQKVQDHYQKIVNGSFESNTELNLDEDEEEVLADLEDEGVAAFGLPPKYSMLEDHHFPLFLSFDQLCSLLEADFGLHFGQSIDNKAHTIARDESFMTSSHQGVPISQADQGAFFDPSFVTEPSEYENAKKAKQAIITFDKFLVAYWPHFDQRLKKGFDPALVYSEFLGVIEGSEAALGTESGAISREEYINESYRRSSFASQRENVYDLYEAYRKRRGQLRNCDVAERTHALVRAMESGIPGKKLDCLYIDEAQDNLLIDIKLLRSLSSNPHGIFMAGDTAQTISAGSSFRFEDLKAFMWCLEVQDMAVKLKKRKAIHPILFHLAVNYRSHSGIVDCASSIVQLVSDLFPDSIDKLQKESGQKPGPPPAFFSGWGRGVVQFKQFLHDNKTTSFGASQAILVRNDAARTTLREQLGDIGLILTLYESKGLEFDDVLLYNFFEDSLPGPSTWRIILTGIESAPYFDEIRHSVICAELKHLYVGLTRARNKCWIWDMSETAEPIKVFWTSHGLIEHCRPGSHIPQLGESSTKDAWAERGRSLFNRELYSQAVLCFERASKVVERDIAGAYEARKQARLSQATGSVEQTIRAFREAANYFLRCARGSTKKQQKICYLRAAECFIEGEDRESAAEAYLCAEEFDLAAKNFRSAGCFDEAVDIVKKYQDCMQATVAEEVLEVAKLEYLRSKDYKKAEEIFQVDEVNLEEQLGLMKDLGLDVAQIYFLERKQQFKEAAEVAFTEHKVMEGIRLLLRSTKTDSARQAAKQALNGLWILLPFGSPDNKLESSNFTTLVQHLKSAKGVLKKSEIHQLEVFQALNVQDRNQLLALAQSHALLGSQQGGRPPTRSSPILSLLCFSRSSDLLVPVKGWTIPEVISKSKLSFLYFSQLLHLARTLDISSPTIQKLMGLQLRKTDTSSDLTTDKSIPAEFQIYSTAMTFDEACSIPGTLEATPTDLGPSFLVLSEVDANRLAKRAIYKTLRSEIWKTTLNDTVEHSDYLEPCLGFAIFGKCNREGCSKQEANSFKLSEEQRQEAFHLRAQALVAQLEIIRIYQPDNVSEYRVLIRTWARKAYELLMPHFPPIGSAICIDPARAPEMSSGFNIIAMWCADALHYTKPKLKYGPKVLSDILVFLDLAFRVRSTSTKFTTYVHGLHSTRLVEPRTDLMLSSKADPYSHYSVVHDFIDFYARKSEHALRRVVHAMHHVVTRGVSIEANVLVHILEFIGREVIVHCRRWSGSSEGIAIFDRMLVPRSWALDLITQPPLMRQKGFSLPDFWSTLYKTIELLRPHENSAHTGALRVLFGFHSPLNFLLRSVLIMRICRLLIIVAANIGLRPHEKEAIRSKVSELLNGHGNLHLVCIKFATTNSWRDFQSALEYSPLDQGADKLVFLTYRKAVAPPPFVHRAKVIRYANIFPDLARLLSLSGATKNVGAHLNPQAKSFVPSTPIQASPAYQTEDPSDVDLFASKTRPQLDQLSPTSEPEVHCILNSSETDTGRKILFWYRKHAARHQAKVHQAAQTIWRYYSRYRQAKAHRAVQIIWKYYYRYRLRHLAPMTATGDKLRKLHSGYMRDVAHAVHPPLLDKCSRQHKQILLGCMPHVVVYLYGLEEANRQEQDSKKRALRTANHRYLEKLQSRIRACSAFAKKIKALIQDLSPGSSRLRQLDSLHERVKRAIDARQAAMKAFGKGSIPTDLEAHYVLGVEAIITPPLAPSQLGARKPELNVSDIGGA